eukprot:CAMPEP_0113538986 /NCGR_PEP_ID=MMETSP0015_2-20120614/7671_1 /TAXON_ID=2838 /ORGANISM="Odontella" /LENGTH=48 /DNA_ID=CAMNT_0000438623 /DNA_START=549 /DNA_END=691 /DNA_ORIENTATION=+ /assembly_acc=CAM_ASM_000160
MAFHRWFLSILAGNLFRASWSSLSCSSVQSGVSAAEDDDEAADALAAP